MLTSGIVLRAPDGSWSADKQQLHSGGSKEPSPRSVTVRRLSDVQRAADRRDTRELYKLAQTLGAVQPTPVPGVKHKNGTLTNDDDESLACTVVNDTIAYIRKAGGVLRPPCTLEFCTCYVLVT